MRRGLAILLLLAACGAPEREELPPPPSAEAPLPATDLAGLPVPPIGGSLAPADNAPLIYMGLDPRSNGVVAITFVMDRDRDGNPYNDPAVELRPAGGKCNLTDVEKHQLAPPFADRPIFGPDEVRKGVTPDQLPAFMAIAVSSEMIRQGLAQDPGETHPQNVCTRKYWERLMAQTRRGTG